VKFGRSDNAIGQTDQSETLSLPPAAFAMNFTQSQKIAGRFSAGESFNAGNLAANLKVH